MLHPYNYTPLTQLKRGPTQNLKLLPTYLDGNIDFLAKTNSDGTNRTLTKLYLLYGTAAFCRTKIYFFRRRPQKKKNKPKNEDDLKILMTLKVTQNLKYCDPFLGEKAPLGLLQVA